MILLTPLCHWRGCRWCSSASSTWPGSCSWGLGPGQSEVSIVASWPITAHLAAPLRVARHRPVHQVTAGGHHSVIIIIIIIIITCGCTFSCSLQGWWSSCPGCLPEYNRVQSASTSHCVQYLWVYGGQATGKAWHTLIILLTLHPAPGNAEVRTVSTPYLCMQYLHTIYIVSTQYVHNIYAVSKHHLLHTIITQLLTMQEAYHVT